jgi:membrane protease YdiL (CAAX protease family)
VLTEKPWRLDALARLIVSVIICVFAGSVIIGATHFSEGAGTVDVRLFLALVAGMLGFLGSALVVIRKPWRAENFTRRFATLLVCLYLGLTLGALAMHCVGSAAAADSTWRTAVATLSIEAASLLLIWRFVREHRIRWAEAFGFAFQWQRSLGFGVLTACVFLPAGWGLQWASAELMKQFQIQPVEQQAVQAFRITAGLWDRCALGAAAILLAPVVEEMFFRGIVYPTVKQLGFPQLALWGTSLFFAAVHGNLATFVPLLLLAVLLTLLYEKTDNLLAPIAAHSLFNIMNFVMLYLSQRQGG